MSFLKQFFGASKQKPLEKANPVCCYESSTADCSIIQQLREKQEQKNEVDSKITAFERHQPVVVDKFIEFLLMLERNRFEMGAEYRSYHTNGAYNSKIKGTFNSHYAVQRFEAVVDEITMEDIDAIYTELKLVKNRVDVLRDLHRQSSQFASEIKALKDTLGIE